jgi:hypothetical protein
MGSSVTVTRGTAAAYAPPAPGMPVHSARTLARDSGLTRGTPAAYAPAAPRVAVRSLRTFASEPA